MHGGRGGRWVWQVTFGEGGLSVLLSRAYARLLSVDACLGLSSQDASASTIDCWVFALRDPER